MSEVFFFLQTCFYASAPKVPEALCFRVVRPSVCPSGFICLRDNSSITWWNFIKLGQKVKLDVTINWLDFEWDCVAGSLWGASPPLQLDLFRLRDNSSVTWWKFINFGQKVKLDVTINWLDFEWDCVAGGGGGGLMGQPPPLRLEFFVYAITQVLLNGISLNLVRRSSWMWKLTD